MGKLYAVKTGKMPGIYASWDDCKANVEGYPGAQYKSFKTAEEAAAYMGWTAGKNMENTKDENIQKQDTKNIRRKNVQEESGLPLYIAEKECLTAYVDGSFNSATGEYGSGAVLIDWEGNIADRLCEKGIDNELATMRNVAGEIKGAEAAMRYAAEHGYKKLVIYHDYEGIAKWCQGLWKTNKSGTIEYKKFFDRMSEKIHIEFVKVKGHSGDMYNDMADELAKKAAGV